MYFNISPKYFSFCITPKIIDKYNPLNFLICRSDHGTYSDISGTLTDTILEFHQRPDNDNLIPTTSQSHFTYDVSSKYKPNTSTMPNEDVYNDILLRLNCYTIFHFPLTYLYYLFHIYRYFLHHIFQLGP